MPRSGGHTPRPAAEPPVLPEERWLKLQSVLAELGDESGLMDEDDFGIALELCQVADAGGIHALIQKCSTADGQVDYDDFLRRCKSSSGGGGGGASSASGGSPSGSSRLVRSGSGNHQLRTSSGGNTPRPPDSPAPSPAPQPPTPPTEDLRAMRSFPHPQPDTVIVEWMWGDAGTAATRALARKNPLRWTSGPLPSTIASISASASPGKPPRPVDLRLRGQAEIQSFSEQAAAISWLSQMHGLLEPQPEPQPDGLRAGLRVRFLFYLT